MGLKAFPRECGQVIHQSDVPPDRVISWPRVVLHQASLTFGQPEVRCSPLADISSGQEWYYFRSGSTLVRHTPFGTGILWPRGVLHQVSFTCGQPEVRCTPLLRHLLAKGDNTSGQAHLWSDIPPMVQASCGQEWCYIRSASHVVSLRSDVPPLLRHLLAKSGTTSGQALLWSDVTPSRGI